MSLLRQPLLVILPLFFIGGLLYIWATPPFEASDELWHWGMVNIIAETGQLPVQNPDVETPWMQEGSQPPLYYLISAALVSGIDRSDVSGVTQPNPHVLAGIPGAVGNKNMVLRDAPHLPLERTLLAVYIIRLFSLLLGCVTLVAVYYAALELSQNRMLAGLALGVTAFNPMFLFIAGAINNDNLVTALNSLIIWQMLVMVNRRELRLWRGLLLALLLALGSLSKLSGLVLMPIVAGAAVYAAYQPGQSFWRAFNWRGLISQGLMIGLVWAALAGWWYLRNIQLYGELFGTRMMVAVAGPRLEPFTLQTLLDEFQGFRFAYWSLFGAVNIMTLRWFYDLMDALTLVALLGLVVVGWRRRGEGRAFAIKFILLGSLITIGFVSIASWTAQTYASQGRLLFPFVAAISPLLALGWLALIDWLPPQRLRTALPVMLVVGLAVFALVVPVASIAPQYALPESLAELPQSARQVYARYGEVELVGYATPDQRYAPGDAVPVTVYWRVLQPSARDYSLYLHATLSDGRVIGKVDSYPGAGRLRTSRWPTGALYADSYLIPLDDLGAVSTLRIQVGWWDYADGALVNAVDTAGQPLASVMLNAGGYAPPQVQQTLAEAQPVSSVTFGSALRLTGYTLVDDRLSLHWQVEAGLPDDYTVFAQVFDAAEVMVGQGDAPPALPTRYWRPGESYVTEHTLVYPKALTEGDYRLMIGWYRLPDFARLPVAAPNDAYPLLHWRLEANALQP